MLGYTQNQTRFLPIPVAALSKAVGQLLLACWDCGFESRGRHGCLCCLLSSRGLWVGLISHPKESY